MSRELRTLLLLATIGFTTPQVSPPPQIALLQTIQLPVSVSRGRYAHWPFYGDTARDHFSMRVVGDQSILVFDTDANTGHWPLVRVKDWWTTHPRTEVLEVPGWSSAEAKPYEKVFIDVQAVPDGRYAVAFSGMMWKNDSHQPDTIVTVIDLSQWRIVTSIHTSEMGLSRLDTARVAANDWMVLRARSGPLERDTTAPYLNLILSIPELHRGPSCTSHLVPYPLAAPASAAAGRQQANDTACQEVFAATGLPSSEALEAHLERDSDSVPAHLRMHYDKETFRDWGGYPYSDIVWENPAFQSDAGLWYGLPRADSGFYELGVYDRFGTKLKAEPIERALCGDTSLGRINSACGCRIIDASEAAHSILALCRQHRHDFSEPMQREWLALLRSDDFSAAGIVDLNNRRHDFPALAIHDARAYVVTLARGEVLSVYGTVH